MYCQTERVNSQRPSNGDCQGLRD